MIENDVPGFAITSTQVALYLPCFILVVFVLTLYISRTPFSRPKVDDDLSHLPVPPRKPGWPLIGNVELTGDKAEFLASCSGDLTSIRLLWHDLVVVSNPEDVAKVFRLHGTYTDIAHLLPCIPLLFGENSVVALGGERHKRLRNIFLPYFQPSEIIKDSRRIQHIAGRRMTSWAQEQTFEACSEIEDFSFELAMSFVGVNYGSFSAEKRNELRKAGHQLISASLSLPINLGRFSLYGRAVASRDKLRGVLLEAMQNHARQSSQQGDAIDNDVLHRIRKARDVDGAPLSADVVLDNLLAFLVGSFDTTSGSIQSIVMNLCRFQNVQDKAHAHIREILDADEYNGVVPIGDDTWHELSYMDQIILESQRFSPPLAISTMRSAIKDFELGGHVIRKGTSLLIDIINCTRTDQHWSDPLKFDPDRFDERVADVKSRISKLGTFGGGARQCIGKGFAKFQLKVIVTLLLRDYTIEFADTNSLPNIKHPMAIELDGPLQVRLTRRNKGHSKKSARNVAGVVGFCKRTHVQSVGCEGKNTKIRGETKNEVDNAYKSD